MIYRLQRKFILICTASVLTVVFLVFGVILALNISSMNRNIDILADRVSEGGGRFPKNFNEDFKPHKRPVKNEGDFDFITPETPFSTRHFTVFFDSENNLTLCVSTLSKTKLISSINSFLFLKHNGTRRDSCPINNFIL